MLDWIVSGVLIMNNQLLGNQEILLINENMNQLICVCNSESSPTCSIDNNGQIQVSFPEENRPIKVRALIKLKDELITVVHQLIEIPQENPVDINVPSPQDLFTVEVKIKSEVGFPEVLNVFIDPIKIEGVPEELTRFFKQVDERVYDAHFVEKPIKEKTFAFKVRPGIYKIGGEYIVYERPMIVEPNFRNYVVNKATLLPEEIQLEGNRYSGFTVNVDSDISIVLSLQELTDEELLQ